MPNNQNQPENKTKQKNIPLSFICKSCCAEIDWK